MAKSEAQEKIADLEHRLDNVLEERDMYSERVRYLEGIILALDYIHRYDLWAKDRIGQPPFLEITY